MDENFKRLIPILNKEEQNLFEKNQLGFVGWKNIDIIEPSKIEKCVLTPSKIFGYWLIQIFSLSDGEIYCKRPIISSAVHLIVKGFELTPIQKEPQDIDYLINRGVKTKERNLTSIYFIQSINGGPVKIGKSTNMDDRLKTLQVGCPFKLQIIKRIENIEHKYEKELHKKFKDYLLHGEWFDEVILDLI